jgi:hypothetical protein
MKVRVTLTLDVGNTAYADAITYFIKQYNIDSTHTVERPNRWDIAEAVENVVNDILTAEFGDMLTGDDENPPSDWEIIRIESLPNP